MQNRRQAIVRQASKALLPLAALAMLSCADILGFEPGTLRPDDEGTDAFSPGASDGASRGGASGASTDAAADARRDNAAGRAGSAGQDAAPDATGRGGAGGATGDGGSKGGSGGIAGGGTGGGAGASAAGGTGGSGGSTAGSGGIGGAGGTGVADGGGGGPIDASPDSGPTCTATQKLCGAACVAKTDPTTGCAETTCTPCAFPNATATCDAAGQCATGTCSPGFANCSTTDPKDGCETDISKAETCGSCTNRCGATAPLCSGSAGTYQCVTGCTAPTSTLCGAQCIDVTTNAAHCGGCTMACARPTNGDATCASSMCDYACHSGYHKCTATGTCASDTDVNACGASCVKCTTPANGGVSCINGGCVVSCNANFHYCDTTKTCADDNSPATCGARCAPCNPPTDPNADPSPTCTNKQCGFKCKTGFNLCNGVCSDTNSVLSCGPMCQVCERPTNASAVSCNGTTCGFTCNPGYEPSGGQCLVATNLYVSTSGSDGNLGTMASPFRTWKRAAQLAQSGTIVHFSPGTYDVIGGDDFADIVPANVTLQGTGPGVTFAGDGQHALTFAGTGAVQSITFTGFGSPFVASAGTQTIKGVNVSNSFDAIRVGGSASMVISDSSSISGGPAVNRYIIAVDSTAQLTVRDSTITGTYTDCVVPQVAGEAIVMSGSAIVSLVGVSFAGNLNSNVTAGGLSKLTLTNSILRHNCGGGLVVKENASAVSTNSSFGAIGVYDGSSVSLTGGTIDTGFGVNFYGTSNGTFRSVVFEGPANVGGTGNYDFGTASSAGDNTFNPRAWDGNGLNVSVDGLWVRAMGNRWVPNVQGADGNGRMPANVVSGPASGANYYIATANSLIEF
jgi:hypothetical protein